MNFNKFAFKTKLLALCFFLVSVTVVVGLVAWYSLQQVGHEYGRITTQVMPKLEAANEQFVEYRRIRITLRTLGLPGLSRAQEEEAIANAKDAIEKYEKTEEKYKSFGFVAGQKEIFDDVHEHWLIFKDVGRRVLELNKKGRPEDKQEMIRIFLTDCPDSAKKYTVAIEKLLSFHKDIAQKRVASAEAIEAQANKTIAAVGSVGAVLALIIAFIFTSSVSKTMTEIADALSESANQLSSASTQIASSSEELSSSASEQAASLEETASALEQISAMIKKASENSTTTASRSSQSQEKAQHGQQAVGLMLTSIEEISQSNDAIMKQIEDSNRQMAEIVTVIQEIGNKTTVINEIVFQTKLLSFNASVEAARAGEHGKGFAVVAEEVGNLAQMSGNAAKEISDMLGSSIPKVEAIVSNTKDRVGKLIADAKVKVDSGVGTAQKCSSLLQEIVSDVSQVTVLAQEISNASREQSEGVAEINKAMVQLDTVTQQNASSSEEAASAAEELSGQAHALRDSVSRLVTIISGEGHAPDASQKAPLKDASAVTSIKQTRAKSSAAKTFAPARTVPMKRVSGSDVTPSHDDRGFEDV